MNCCCSETLITFSFLKSLNRFKFQIFLRFHLYPGWPRSKLNKITIFQHQFVSKQSKCSHFFCKIMFNMFSVPPTVSLDIGKALNLNDLEEGDDVYFECSISANPPPYKVTWLHNVSESSFFSHKHYVSELYLYL